MEKKSKRAIGLIFVVVGILSLLGSLGSITGYVALGEGGEQTVSILGVLMVVGGIVLVLVGKEGFD